MGHISDKGRREISQQLVSLAAHNRAHHGRENAYLLGCQWLSRSAQLGILGKQIEV